jgi:hypothetical protein
MATQGLVSVVRDGKVVLKVITGCDGYNARLLANELVRGKCLDLEYVYNLALAMNFGGRISLVVMNADDVLSEDEVSSLYRETFDNPRFNPRWASGMIDDDCLAIVEVKS